MGPIVIFFYRLIFLIQRQRYILLTPHFVIVVESVYDLPDFGHTLKLPNQVELNIDGLGGPGGQISYKKCSGMTQDLS